MKILMLVNRFYPDIGGVEKHTYKISQEFIKDGNEVEIVTFTKNKDSLPKEEIDGIKINRIFQKSKWNNYFWMLKNIKLIINSDIIHCHDFSTFCSLYFPFRFLLLWKKVYITFHGWEGDMPPKRKIIKIRKIVEKLTYGNISIGHFIEKWYGTKADIVTYGAAEMFPKLKLDFKKNTFVYIGRLEEDTGIEMYLKTFKMLKEKYNLDLKIDICGDGSLRKKLENYVETNKINGIFHGFVNNPEYYIEKSEFSLTSGYLGILESMIQKKIVISNYENKLKKDYLTLIPNAKNMLIISNNSIDLSQKIFSILFDEERKGDLINNSYNWAKDLTWEKMKGNYYNLWRIKK